MMSDKWYIGYNLAKKYYDYYGNLLITRNFKTIDGINESNDENAINLGKWINTQRCNYKKNQLSSERIKLLNDIDMVWQMRDRFDWNYYYSLAIKYYKYYGHLQIPTSFKTVDGINYSNDENAINLGKWISRQRSLYIENKLSKDRIKLLNELEMIYDRHENSWITTYKLAINYYNYYGNLIVPRNFNTVDGVNKTSEECALNFKKEDEINESEDKEVSNLSRWITVQRSLYKKGKLSKNRIQLLNSIGMVWEAKNVNEWEEYYKLAINYYSYYGSLLIATDFKTEDGIMASNSLNAKKLGFWISNQRTRYRKGQLSETKIYLLEKIGMIWNIRRNKYNILNLLEQREILMEYNKINKEILDNISYQEFYSKLMFLLENKISVINDENILNDIFKMSNKKLEEIYNISIEQLLNKYYYKSKRKEVK